MEVSSYLTGTLHVISQGLLIPTVSVLILLIVITVGTIGSLMVELFTERRMLKENIPGLLASVHKLTIESMKEKVKESKILKRQKQSLEELLNYAYLPQQSLEAVAKRLLATEEEHYNKILSVSDLIARIAPMLGLMGTLIPLGPGLLALGQGDTKTLATSLLTAFDTTIAGLTAAAVCCVISKIRGRWYDDYMISMESIMETVLEEAKDAKES